MQMRIQDHRPSLCVLGASLLISTVATAQTPLEVEEAIEQAKTALERNAGSDGHGVLRLDTTEQPGIPTIGLSDASFSSSTPSQDTDSDAADAPSEGFFFSDDEPRAFWRSKNGRRIVHPVTAPNYQDDAYITSDVRFNYLNHQLPNNNVLPGGAVRAYDFQFRYAVNERLQIQLSKAGYADVQIGPLDDVRGTDAALSVKYAFLQDWENQTHASVGLGYELDVGSANLFGDSDDIRLFAAFNQGFDRSHIGLSANALFSAGQEGPGEGTDRVSLHFHYDYELNEYFSPIVELNFYDTFSCGSGVLINGTDLGDLGGNDAAFIAGFGGEVRLLRDVATRIAYETPLIESADIFGYRFTLSALWRF